MDSERIYTRMAELTQKNVSKHELLSMQDWAKKYAEGISNTAVSYLMKNDIIDYIWIGRFRIVVLTPKTLEYVPNSNPNRAIMRT